MHLMQNISGPIPCHVIQKVCQHMKHHMNSRLRKNVSNRDKRRKLQSARKYSILLHILACLRFSIQASHIKSGPGRLCTMLHPWQLVRTITMQNPEDREARTGTHRVGIKAVAIIIRTVEASAVAMGVAHIPSKDGDLHRSLQQVVHVAGLAVDMELVGQIIHKVVRRRHMARLVQAEARTILLVVLAISSSMEAGNSMTTSSGDETPDTYL